MKSRAARVHVTLPGRNFVPLIVETDEGVCGFGDGALTDWPR